MALSLRVQFSDALCHVTARGNERKPAFRDKYDRLAQVRKFLSLYLSAGAQARTGYNQQPPPVLCRCLEGPLHLPRLRCSRQDRELRLPPVVPAAPPSLRMTEKLFSVSVAADDRSLRILGSYRIVHS
jgi:hypothetical protein